MALNTGTRLGPYEIRTPLGAGGMGEVYKAVDTRLDRTVAIKVLPAHVSADPELRQRFEREARTISSLNHPHICTLHDVGHQDDLHYLVMEYVEGETLAARLERGALPVDQALRYAIEIADALDKAHRQGITHRDLKPANIMLTKSGTKLLDFGLAKPATRTGALDVTRPQSLSPSPTAQGTILGTIQYMSPEQLEGGQADARSDIFAFGAVLFEMVTGKKVFEGKSQASVIAAILEREAPAVSSQQPLAPPTLDRIVAKCLVKDPDARWQSAHDLADELTWIRQGVHPETASGGQGQVTPGVSWRTMIGAAIVAALAVVIAAGITWSLATSRGTSPDTRVMRFLVETPPVSLVSGVSVVRTLTQGVGHSSLAISRDGRRMAFVALQEGVARLHVRSFDDTTARPIPGTEGAEGPFFSPDGERVGFFASAELRVVSLRGGRPSALASAPTPRGGTWAPDGHIYFSPGTETGIWRVPDTGGAAEQISRPDPAIEVRSHRWPSWLPGGTALLITVSRATNTTFDQAQVAVLTIATGEVHDIVEGASFGTYAASGHLVYAQSGALLAAPFHLARLDVSGPATTVLTNVTTDPITGAAHFAVSDDGMLAYASGDVVSYDRALVWVDRAGVEEALPLKPQSFQDVRLSPDGRRLALDLDGATATLWIYELARGSLSKLTLSWSNNYPVWSRDSASLTFVSGRGGVRGSFYRQSVDRSGAAELVLAPGNAARKTLSFTDDGRLVFSEQRPDAGNDIFVLEEGRDPVPMITGPFEQDWAALSSDNALIAYVSNESGRDEIYVQPRAGGGKAQASLDGGTQPIWARSGRELFYRQGLAMMAVTVTSSLPLEFSRPRRLFEGPYVPRYDVAADGRFLMIKGLDRSLTRTITVVTNWFAELNRLAPR